MIFLILTHAFALINTSENFPCALVSGSFSVALSSSVLVELGYASRVQKERHEDITFFYLKNPFVLINLSHNFPQVL